MAHVQIKEARDDRANAVDRLEALEKRDALLRRRAHNAAGGGAHAQAKCNEGGERRGGGPAAALDHDGAAPRFHEKDAFRSRARLFNADGIAPVHRVNVGVRARSRGIKAIGIVGRGGPLELARGLCGSGDGNRLLCQLIRREGRVKLPQRRVQILQGRHRCFGGLCTKVHVT